ncbi:putative lytic tail protein [Pseudomonas phage tabernarius]|uniref:Putative lytic tail protein n=1 Tax=Pseudomonas phage tabernarius TaxID=2048978 RepID=A0A2H4P6U2_9CAUD|nr:lytic tail protein [Pseudomonas phage tabernarius]ATW57899.1 putative lytic tail protein [Pseudomonas phage tabernarius]
MANETEKFVLQYVTEIKDSVKKLEELQNKVKKTNEATDAAKKGFSEFSDGVSDQLSKIVPQVDGVTKAVKMMTAEFAVASVAVGVLAVGVKAVMMANENITKQRSMGQQIGMAPNRIEQLTRDFSDNSQGRLNRDQAMDSIKSFGDRVQEARQDLPGTGARRNFTMNGLQVGTVQNHPTLTSMFNTIGGRVQGMDEAKGRAYLNQIGMSPDMLGNFQKFGNKTGDRMLSKKETDERKEAEDASKKVNDELNKINNQFTEMGLILGQKLLPWAEKFTSWMLDVTKFVFSDTKTPVANYNNDPFAKPTDKELAEAQKYGGKNPLQFGARHPEAVKGPGITPQIANAINNGIHEPEDKGASNALTISDKNNQQLIGNSKQEKQALEKFTKEQADITAKQQEAQNKEDEMYDKYSDATAEQKLAAQMFTTAVATFAHATDMNDALAMWAGSIGAASGLKGADGTQSGNTGAAAIGPYASQQNREVLGSRLITSGTAESIGGKEYTHKYDELYNKYGTAMGIDPRILKAQGMQESGLHNDNRGNGGGLGQLSPNIQKKYGVTDVHDAEQNIRASAMYMKDLIKETGGNIAEALKRYIGGGPENKKNQGKQTNEYAGKVYKHAGLTADDFENSPSNMGSMPNVIIGKGKAGRQVMDAVRSLASYMNIDPGQITGHHTTRGDMEFSMGQLERSLINNHQDLVNKTHAINVPEKEMASYRQQLRQNEIDQQNLKAFGGNVLDMATEGGRTAETNGLIPVTINVQTTSQDPYKQGQIAADSFNEHRRDLVKQNASTVKY